MLTITMMVFDFKARVVSLHLVFSIILTISLDTQMDDVVLQFHYNHRHDLLVTNPS